MSQVATLEDYTKVLETVAEKSKAAGQDVIGVSGLVNAWPMAAPYESLTGNSTLRQLRQYRSMTISKIWQERLYLTSTQVKST